MKIIKRLESNAIKGHHDSIWKALSAVELLLSHLERKKYVYEENSYLAISVNLA